MSIRHSTDSIVRSLEKRFGREAVYAYFSAFEDVVVRGHTSSRDDNPHFPEEQPSHDLYQSGAVAAEKLLAELRHTSVNNLLTGEGGSRN
jgi:hypothetical protein